MRGRAALAAALALGLVPAAHATSAPAGEVRALARAAAEGDSGALARLRAVDVVDGRPLPIAPLLEDTSGDELEARLRTLGAEPGTASVPGDPAEEAARILDDRRFRGSSVPQPLHGVLAWFGDKIAWPFRKLDGVVPGGGSVLWVVLGALVVAAAALLAARLSLRRGGIQIERGRSVGAGRSDDPARLEREADEAERSGELSRALRLRFRAGLIRLARARAIPRAESITSGQVRRALRSRDFDGLARTFDEVVYGGRAARPGDVEAAREGWPRVLAEVRPR